MEEELIKFEFTIDKILKIIERMTRCD